MSQHHSNHHDPNSPPPLVDGHLHNDSQSQTSPQPNPLPQTVPTQNPLFPPHLLQQLAAEIASQIRSNPIINPVVLPPLVEKGPSPVNTLPPKSLQEQLDDLKKLFLKGGHEARQVINDDLEQFTEEIRNEIMPTNFQMPRFWMFNGKGNPRDHLSSFTSDLGFFTQNGNVFARAFPSTLEGHARTWYTRLPIRTIDSWSTFRRLFMNKFGSTVTTDREEDALLEVRQRHGETLRSYYNRFEEMARQIPRIGEDMYIMAFKKGLMAGNLFQAIALRKPQDKEDLLHRVNEYIHMEEAMQRQSHPGEGKNTPQKNQAWVGLKKGPMFDRNKGNIQDQNARYRRPGMDQQRNKRSYDSTRNDNKVIPTPISYTPLLSPPSQIYAQISDKNTLPKPIKMKSPLSQRNEGKWCEYHKDRGHLTDECRHLKAEIEKLIKRGYLGEYVDRSIGPNSKTKEPNKITAPENNLDAGSRRILTIAGGPGGGGDSSNKRKIYARRDVYSINTTPFMFREPIYFTDEDLRGLELPHDDPLIIAPVIGNVIVERMLVDTGSSADILFARTYDQLGLARSRIMPLKTSLIGFTGHRIDPIGTTWLNMTVGTYPRCVTVSVQFTIVDVVDHSYNGLIGRTSLNALKAIVSPLHLMLKFPTPGGIGQIKGNQKRARICYMASTKKAAHIDLTAKVVKTKRIQVNQNQGDPSKQKKDNSPKEKESEKLVVPNEKIEKIEFEPGNSEKTFRIGTHLDPQHKENLVQLIRRYKEVFAWSPADMPGVDPEIAIHKLHVNPENKPVKQKKRNFNDEKSLAIRREVEKLKEAGAIRELQFPSWIANVVLVKKSNGDWRMCTDFTSLNKACPKDWFPLPCLNRLVDGSAGYEMFDFLDAFRGYHQIFMTEEDQEKTTFITEYGLYCWRVMPFGLKNAGATYQRMVNSMFKDQVGRNMEIYVDDMLIKSRKRADHLENLEESLQKLKKGRLRLNPEKCSFGVISGKFLGYMISQQGIEPNPDKIKAVIEMKQPNSYKDIQKLTGCLAALNRFISKSGDRNLAFFRNLRRAPNSKFIWDDESDKAFRELKDYLASPKLLSRPEPGETLQLYLAVSEGAVSGVLVRQEANIQRPVYYVSHVLHGSEENYPVIDKFVFALVVAARKLKTYFESHPIQVLTNQPMKKVISSPVLSGRLTAWAVELSEFEITYVPRTSIKAQVLADFVVECTDHRKEPTVEPNQKETLIPWVLFVDGARNQRGSGAGILLQGPEGIQLEYALRFEFDATNNEAEYEAMITGLMIVKALGVGRILVKGDSKLVIEQIRGDCGVKGETLAKYHEKALRVVKEFEEVVFQHIPRAKNEIADRLSQLATTYFDELPLGIHVEIRKYRCYEELEVKTLREEPADWRTPIEKYLRDDILPQDKIEARKLKQRSFKYQLVDEELYKKSQIGPWMRCVGDNLIRPVLEEVHEGQCGSHIGGRILALKIKRAGFWWPTLMKDAGDHVRKCEECQKLAPVPRRPVTDMTYIVSPIPFAMWGVDIVGKLPIAKGNFSYAIVAVDYFTKWVEAKPVATITCAQVKNFLWKHIITRYGIPRVLVTDNGTQFEGAAVKELCTLFQIEQRFSPVCYPQANGQVEVMNRTIFTGIKKNLLQQGGQWTEEMDRVLWSYRTTPSSSTGETPFSLIYGVEAVLPLEIGLPSLRLLHYKEQENEEKLRSDLDFVDELRDRAWYKLSENKQKMARFYNQRVKARQFKVGDLVLRMMQASKPMECTKLGPKWEGPYKVRLIVGPATYKLETMEGKDIQHTWHAMNLRKFHV